MTSSVESDFTNGSWETDLRTQQGEQSSLGAKQNKSATYQRKGSSKGTESSLENSDAKNGREIPGAYQESHNNSLVKSEDSPEDCGTSERRGILGAFQRKFNGSGRGVEPRSSGGRRGKYFRVGGTRDGMVRG
ncbi:hypothetical protein HYALB_00003064 [Hymenoscyphus albidus]|uniref:Uncharacterized protein n=1 Tax=Hymenoscyphus albidus TaxID=595503 RepID=A0A9N9LXE5_9HELO|nr:hypothetical protein HYALB_00003064 [Hymenoscyphus albidus]